MRLYQTGFELDHTFELDGANILMADRWTTSLVGNSTGIRLETTGALPWVHKTSAGFGGQCALYRNNSSTEAIAYSNRFPHNFREAWIGFALKIPNSENTRIMFGNSLENLSISSPQMEILLNPGGSGSLWSGSSVSGINVASHEFLLTPGYHWFSIQYLLNNTGGYFYVYADDELYLSFNGDTRGNDNYNYWDRVVVSLGYGSAIDDFIINGITISYINGAGGGGTPAIGNTVTGGTSGSTAIITEFREINPGEGYLVLEQVSAGFNNGETLTDGSGWSATTSIIGGADPGLDKNSGKPDETFLVLTKPNGTVSAGLMGSDGDQIDNHLQVNDTFTDESTYNFAINPGIEDIYSMETLPFSPETIDAVEVAIYASRSGSIVGAQAVLDTGSGNTYSETLRVGSGSTAAKASKIYNVNPDTGADWLEEEVNATDVGVRFV